MTLPSSFAIVGQSSFLPNLRADLRYARRLIFVIGPWMDGYFCREVFSYGKKSTPVQVLTRPLDESDPEKSMSKLNGLRLLKESFGEFSLKFLDTLHAKLILVDGVCYFGSMNWYEYSMKNVYEFLVRGTIDEIPELKKEVQTYWENATEGDLERIGRVIESKIREEGKRPSSFDAIHEEILDPLAQSVMKENPKAFVLRRKGSSAVRRIRPASKYAP